MLTAFFLIYTTERNLKLSVSRLGLYVLNAIRQRLWVFRHSFHGKNRVNSSSQFPLGIKSVEVIKSSFPMSGR